MLDIPLELPQPLKAVMGCWDFGKSLGWVVGWGFWEELLVVCWIRILGRARCLSSFHCHFPCSFNPFSSLSEDLYRFFISFGSFWALLESKRVLHPRKSGKVNPAEPNSLKNLAPSLIWSDGSTGTSWSLPRCWSSCRSQNGAENSARSGWV